MIVILSPFLFYAPVYARVVPMQFFTYRELRLAGPDAPSASGSGTYDDNSEKPSFSLTFQHLVPNALYTVWCSNVILPMKITGSRPCGAIDWSNDTFWTDAVGNGTVYTPLPSPFPPSTKERVTMISVVYESDGKTATDTTNFGITSYPQLVYFFPSFESATQIPNQRSGISVWAWAGLGGLVVCTAFLLMKNTL